ncbi:hypothetical protein [Legionella sp. km772]|uniref:hypothetical protein n=1 Tax=Legionella sp. km772 TaxID=2498111 RepID=UPI000F8D5247|nr:hypothetical protein [Legionella sp. km772]RUR10430.1 hypothetical protein ELY15_08140 [Legionella sp. km772]
MSVHLSVKESNLFIAIKGIDIFLTCKNKLNIPLKNIVAVAPYKGEYNNCFKGIRAPGVNIPGLVTAGTFYQHGKKIFWGVKNSDKSIMIDLKDNSFTRIIIEVDNPEESIKNIKASISH